jgi:hypothetical protein
MSGGEWCGEVIEVTLPDGDTETLRCTSRIVDGEHSTESHRATMFWGDLVRYLDPEDPR